MREDNKTSTALSSSTSTASVSATTLQLSTSALSSYTAETTSSTTLNCSTSSSSFVSTATTTTSSYYSVTSSILKHCAPSIASSITPLLGSTTYQHQRQVITRTLSSLSDYSYVSRTAINDEDEDESNNNNYYDDEDDIDEKKVDDISSSKATLKAMGNASSAASRVKTREQEDLKYLADRFPFGDAELVHLYRSYHQKDPTQDSTSFLVDWSVRTLRQQETLKRTRRAREQQQQQQRAAAKGTSPSPPSDTAAAAAGLQEDDLELLLRERRTLLEIAERAILTPQFGNKLYECAFLSSGDISRYNCKNDNPSTSDNDPSKTNATTLQNCMDRGGAAVMHAADEQQEDVHVDEYTRLARIEKFFEGISNSSRRGSKSTLAVLAKVCSSPEESSADWISAYQFISLGYRIAITIAFLHTAERAAKASAVAAAAAVTVAASASAATNDNAESGGTNSVADDVDDDGDDIVTPQDYLLIQQQQSSSIGSSEHSTAASTNSSCDSCVSGDDGFDEYELTGPIRRKLKLFARSLIERGKARRQRAGDASSGYSSAGAVYDATMVPPSSAAAIDEDRLIREGYVQLEDIIDWAEDWPVFASLLPTLLYEIFFPGRPYPPSRTPFDYPRLNVPESSFFSTPSSPLLFAFACSSSSLNGEYYRLFTSESDGLSFNRLLNALLGYAGPTLLLIRDTESNVFGAFTASPWKESKDFYGHSDCFLFSITNNTMAVYRPTGNASNFMYCNPAARSRGFDQQAHGIGFGGSVMQPRLFLSEGLDETCRASSQDLTFENGTLLGGGNKTNKPTSFTVEGLEVWAVGGDKVVQKGLGARDQVRQFREEGIRRARKVDKAQFLDDLRSGAISSKAFAHRAQIDGRADEDVKERHTLKYDYEK